MVAGFVTSVASASLPASLAASLPASLAAYHAAHLAVSDSCCKAERKKYTGKSGISNKYKSEILCPRAHTEIKKFSVSQTTNILILSAVLDAAL